MLSWVAISGFILLTLVAAGRLVAVWRRTGLLPELLIAVLIFGVGTVAVGVGAVLRSLMPGSAALHVPIVGADVGMAALAIFTWKVYRPSSRAARTAAVLLIACLFGLLVHSIVDGWGVALETNPASIANSAAYVGVMGWSAVEAWLYWRPMVRRRRLGLADAVVTNRVLLWAIATGVAAVGILLGAVAQHGMGVDPGEAVWMSVVYALHGSVSAVAFWLAFAPPAGYARWLESRAATAAA